MAKWIFFLAIWLICHVVVYSFQVSGQKHVILYQSRPSQCIYIAPMHSYNPPASLFATAQSSWSSKKGLSTANQVIPRFLRQVLSLVLIPIALQIILITVFNVDPALAGVVSSSQVSANAKAADATQLSPSAEPKWQIILKRVFYGANAKLNFRKWRAGDTRGDNLMLLLNAVSMCALMGGLLFVATIIGQREAAKEMWHMKKEVLREKKYRESMYIDAVRAILTKISDPNIKPSIKKDLGLQLRQLDPTGKIREFIETGEKGELDVGLDVKSKREKSTNNPKRSGPNGASENKKKKESDSSQGDRQSKTSSSSNNGGNGNDGNRGSKADSSGGDKAVNLLLAELKNSLMRDMPSKQIDKLVSYLKMRLMAISSGQKRSATIAKVEQKLGDISYWKDFVDELDD